MDAHASPFEAFAPPPLHTRGVVDEGEEVEGNEDEDDDEYEDDDECEERRQRRSNPPLTKGCWLVH